MSSEVQTSWLQLKVPIYQLLDLKHPHILASLFSSVNRGDDPTLTHFHNH